MAKKTKKTNIKVLKDTRTLKVQLTDHEVLEYGDQLAQAIDKGTALEEEKKAVVESFKAKLAEALAAVQRLTNFVRNKYDYKGVDCEEVLDNNTGFSRTTRLDTGELIDERKLTHDERQGTLFDEEAA